MSPSPDVPKTKHRLLVELRDFVTGHTYLVRWHPGDIKQAALAIHRMHRQDEYPLTARQLADMLAAADAIERDYQRNCPQVSPPS